MSDATKASIASTNPGTTSTPEKTSGSASAASVTFLGVSRVNTAQVVVQIQTYSALKSTPTVNNGVVQLTVPDGSGNQGTTSYLLVEQSKGITDNWSFDLQVSTPSGNGGGKYTFTKGVGSEMPVAEKEVTY